MCFGTFFFILTRSDLWCQAAIESSVRSFWTYLSHSCSRLLSIVNVFMEVPVMHLSWFSLYRRFRYKPWMSSGRKERLHEERNDGKSSRARERIILKLKGVLFPRITEKKYSWTSFQQEYSRSGSSSKNSLWRRPSIWYLLKVVTSPSIKEKLWKAYFRSRCAMLILAFKSNTIIKYSPVYYTHNSKTPRIRSFFCEKRLLPGVKGSCLYHIITGNSP